MIPDSRESLLSFRCELGQAQLAEIRDSPGRGLRRSVTVAVRDQERSRHKLHAV